MGTILCDVNMTLKRHEKNGNIFFITGVYFSTGKCMFSCSFSFAVHHFSLILVHFQIYYVLYGFSIKDDVSCILYLFKRHVKNTWLKCLHQAMHHEGKYCLTT